MKSKMTVITGASSGIGRAIAELLHATRYRVVNADKSPPSADSPVPFIPCDITRGEEIDRLYQTVMDEYESPSILISNAGVNIHEKLMEGDPEKWVELLNTNVVGGLRLIRSFAHHICENQGHFIFITSVAARKPYPYGGVYAASKAALETIAETLRLEVQPKARVSVIAPGTIHTPFFRNSLSGPRDVRKLGWAEVSPKQVALHVRHILSTPDELNIDYSIVRPRDQPF